MGELGSDYALVLAGGGARAAFQVGVMRVLAQRFPEAFPRIRTGVSAGAINTAFLANHFGSIDEVTGRLADVWLGLKATDVFESGVFGLLDEATRIAFQLLLGRPPGKRRGQGLVDTKPLRKTLRNVLHSPEGRLSGVRANLEGGRLKAVALTATAYSTGQAVTFFDGDGIGEWERPYRRSVRTRLTVDHVMASSALPLIFPPVNLGDAYYGDGGIGLVAPFSPAIHLGARRILAVSTRHVRSPAESAQLSVAGPPAAARVLDVLYSAVFLDNLEQDVLIMERVNALIRRLPPEELGNLRQIGLLVIRPSRDIGVLATQFEPKLPRAFRFLTRRFGTKRARSQDIVSALLFQSGYLRELYDLGVHDAEARAGEIERFLAP